MSADRENKVRFEITEDSIKVSQLKEDMEKASKAVKQYFIILKEQDDSEAKPIQNRKQRLLSSKRIKVGKKSVKSVVS